jgi:hypothetical protein
MLTSAPGALVKIAKVEKYCWKMCISLFKSQDFDYFNAKLPLLVSLTSALEALVRKTQFLMYKHYFEVCLVKEVN